MHYLQHLARKGAVYIHPGGQRASALLLQRLELRSGDTVLELGCGTGATLLRAVSAAPVRAVGVDAMPEMLAAARRRLNLVGSALRPALVSADIARLPFARMRFDRAYAESVLGMQQASQIHATLRELHRVLKPGAVCVLNDAIWKEGATVEDIAEANRRCEQSFGLRQASLEPWRLQEWRNAMRAAGFLVRSAELVAMPARSGAGGVLLRSGRAAMRRIARLRDKWNAMCAAAGSPRQRYAQALWQHRALGQLIEARLFVLVRD